jgi:hypothetical protein
MAAHRPITPPAVEYSVLYTPRADDIFTATDDDCGCALFSFALKSLYLNPLKTKPICFI